jgi:hypothetical protein
VLLGWRTKGGDSRVLRTTGEKDEGQSAGHAAVAARRAWRATREDDEGRRRVAWRGSPELWVREHSGVVEVEGI